MTTIVSYMAVRANGTKFFFEARDLADAYYFCAECNEHDVIVYDSDDRADAE